MLRSIHDAVDLVLPAIGVAAVVIALLPEMQLWQLALVVVGLVLIEAGLMNMGHRLLPNRRRFVRLRTEGDVFLGLLRRLNATSVAVREWDSPQTRLALEEAQLALRQSVDRMIEVAGDTVAQADEVGRSDTEVVSAIETAWRKDFFGSA